MKKVCIAVVFIKMKNLLKKILFRPVFSKQIVRILSVAHRLTYYYLGVFACAAEGGLHPKHRLTKYHQFFVNNISEGDSVLEVGCGNGALLIDIARKNKAYTVGIEISSDSADLAKQRMADISDVSIINGDIFEYNDTRKFDVLIFSNTLEHLCKRTQLLKCLVKNLKPQKILIRVPMFEREWPVPYKKELGVEWRLDPTHEIEYTQKELQDELFEAGLGISSLDIRWGEFYVVAVPSG